MSTYIEADSVWRDRRIYTNPCNYEVTVKQSDVWNLYPREVRAIPPSSSEKPLDFVSSISVSEVTLPYPRIELFASYLITVTSIISDVFTMSSDQPITLKDGDKIMTSSPGFLSSLGLKRNIEYTVMNFDLDYFYANVRVATNSITDEFIDLANAPAQVDGVTLITGDRVLVKNGTTVSNPASTVAIPNGIYVFTAGAPNTLTRAADFAAASLQTAGRTVHVTAGSTNYNTTWSLATTVTVDVDPVEWLLVAEPPYGATFQLSSDGGVTADTSFSDSTGLSLVLAVITSEDYTEVMSKFDSSLILVTLPKIYLDVHCRDYPDSRMLNSIGDVLPTAKFALIVDKIQVDDNLTPIWIHYKSQGEQVMRFKRNSPIAIKYMNRDGTIITFFDEPDLTVPTNPNMQNIISINITPYTRDALYSNHLTSPIPQ